MEGYLGEFPVTPDCESWNELPSNWALYFIEQYGQIDGAHHKQWVLDQVARVLNGAPVTAVEARWENGETELRASVGTCPKYEEWVEDMRGDGEYEYDEGTPP